MTTALRFLGKGWTIPLEPNDRSGRLSYESGAEKVRQSIWIILDTEPGETGIPTPSVATRFDLQGLQRLGSFLNCLS